MADELKAKGNAAFSAKNFTEAIGFFTDAIAIDPSNHVLYSNRSASYASMEKYNEALEDAKKCVELKPDWPKGYSRLGAAYFGLEDWPEAAKAYEDGLKIDPANEQMKQALAEAKQAAKKPQNPFARPDFLAKLATDPRTRGLLTQPDFMVKLQHMQRDTNAIGMYLQDPRMQLVLQVGLGLSFGGPGADASAADDEVPPAEPADDTRSAPAAETSKPAPEPTPAPEPEPELNDEEREAAAKKAEALKEKEAGNEAYKKRQFEEAIQHYNKALELYDGDISFLTNRAAVYFEMGEYEQCAADCDAAVEKGRAMRADFKIIARALTRKGNALAKQDKLEEAIEVYQKALMEHRNADTLKRLNEAERTLKDKREQAYIDLELAAQEKDAGNLAFKEQRYPEAVKHYEESLKRGPPSVNPEAYKVYSNLAASFTKLGALQDALKAAEKCIELEPTFVKGYSRKGSVQYFMKDYDKAMETYEKGLELDPENEEIKAGMQSCMEAINRLTTGQASQEEVKERQAKAMADPEVQRILTDPVMRQVLQDFQEDPKAAQQHLRQPEIMAKIQKLAAAGIIQLK